MNRSYRPVLDDDDLILINIALVETVESRLDSAQSGSPEDMADALDLRGHARNLIERFERLMMRDDGPTQVPGQMTLTDLIDEEEGDVEHYSHPGDDE